MSELAARYATDRKTAYKCGGPRTEADGAPGLVEHSRAPRHAETRDVPSHAAGDAARCRRQHPALGAAETGGDLREREPHSRGRRRARWA